MIETLFRAFVVFQPFLWIWMLEDERFEALNDERVRKGFNLAGIFFIFFVGILKIEIGFYSTALLMLYSGMVIVCVAICIEDYHYPFKDALAIGFLIVYLNSWYWEGVLHIWAIQENGLNLNQLFQLLHLIPALYFLLRWEFDPHESGKLLMKGWAFAGLITFTRKARLWQYLPIVFTDAKNVFIDRQFMNANRLICFYYLLKAIVRWGMPKIDLEPEGMSQVL